MVQQGDGKVIVFLRHALRGAGAGEQGVGLVGEGKNHVELPQTHAVELFQHGQSVEHVAEVDQQGQQSRLDRGGPRHKQADPKILPRPCVDGDAHQHRQQKGVPRRVHHQPKGDADGQITHQDGDGGPEGGAHSSFHPKIPPISPKTGAEAYCTRFRLRAQEGVLP